MKAGRQYLYSRLDFDLHPRLGDLRLSSPGWIRNCMRRPSKVFPFTLWHDLVPIHQVEEDPEMCLRASGEGNRNESKDGMKNNRRWQWRRSKPRTFAASSLSFLSSLPKVFVKFSRAPMKYSTLRHRRSFVFTSSTDSFGLRMPRCRTSEAQSLKSDKDRTRIA